MRDAWFDGQRIGVAAASIALLLAATPAFAAAPTGACCFSSGACQELTGMACEDAGASFIGDGTACADVNCGARVAAPLLSGAGVVAAIFALAATWVLRMSRRRGT